MNLVVTMTAYRRPEYTRQVLAALADCRGIENCLFLPQVEPGHEEVIQLFRGWDACESRLIVNPQRLGLNRNSFTALMRARQAKCDAVIHVEDDTVPSPDTLDFFRWGFEQFEHDHSVFSLGAWNKPDTEPLPAQSHECCSRNWLWRFGWGTWKNRLGQILANWCFRNPKNFGWHINTTRGNRREIHPVLSRIQNIGYEQGESGYSPEWYRANHRTPWVATDSDLLQFALK